ncbi:hypothetical protein GGX14DRAFT_595573 [Mycena pura]|uniref:Protein kinase domain-containing protein n=1 Tax=Mycena pura TaxID=153505 RepID=A0AAD6VPA3_9AGAR|nr:hypothetical protein GGX14DRAFT_595573 [Mycena pura]
MKPSTAARLQLVTHFVHKGIEQDGDHLQVCLLLKLEQATLLEATQNDHRAFYPFTIVKRILRRLLLFFTNAGGVHTDVKPDNVMDSLCLYKTVTQAVPFVSTQLPIPSVAELEACVSKLADFSNVQLLDDSTTYEVQSHYVPQKLSLEGHGTKRLMYGPLDVWCSPYSRSSRYFHTASSQSTTNISGPELYLNPHPAFSPPRKALFTSQHYPPSVLALYPNSPRCGVSRCVDDYWNAQEFREKIWVMPPGDVTQAALYWTRALQACALAKRCLQISPNAHPLHLWVASVRKTVAKTIIAYMSDG